VQTQRGGRRIPETRSKPRREKRVVCTAPRPFCLRKREPVSTVQEAGWVSGPVRTGLENLAPLRWVDPWTIQTVASRYTDWPIPAHKIIQNINNMVIVDIIDFSDPYFILILSLFHIYIILISYLYYPYFIFILSLFHIYIILISYLYYPYFVFILSLFHIYIILISYLYYPYFIFMYTHYNHWHRMTAHLQLNILLLLLLLLYVIYVFLLWCLCILIVCSCIFMVPTGILRLPWLRFFRPFSSVVKEMPGYNSQRRGTVRTLPN